MNLTQRLQERFERYDVSQDQQESISLYLNLVNQRDEPTYEHSVRVGLTCGDVAEFTHIAEPKALFYPGLLHDVGKSLTDPKSLKKHEGFDERDMKELKKHPIDGYRLLRGVHDFSARVLLYHHWFTGGYPSIIPLSDIDFSKGTQTLIMYCARLVGLVDFYDAASNRKNDKFTPGRPNLPSREEVKDLLLKNNSDQAFLINKLYESWIF